MKTTLSSIIGIDPGQKGAFCVIHPTGKPGVHRMPDSEEATAELVKSLVAECNAAKTCPAFVIEQVQGYIGKAQPGGAMFSFGKGYGFVRGCVYMAGYAPISVPPRRWQDELAAAQGWEPHADENHKEALALNARRLYPDIQINKDHADAVLIAHWGSLFLGLL